MTTTCRLLLLGAAPRSPEKYNISQTFSLSKHFLCTRKDTLECRDTGELRKIRRDRRPRKRSHATGTWRHATTTRCTTAAAIRNLCGATALHLSVSHSCTVKKCICINIGRHHKKFSTIIMLGSDVFFSEYVNATVVRAPHQFQFVLHM